MSGTECADCLAISSFAGKMKKRDILGRSVFGNTEDWNFSFSISPPNEYTGLISFRIDWFDLLAVQGTLRSLLQNHNSKTLILRCSAFFMDQLSHPYMTTEKNHSSDYTEVCHIYLLYINEMKSAEII